jgi:hypothetical protein
MVITRNEECHFRRHICSCLGDIYDANWLLMPTQNSMRWLPWKLDFWRSNRHNISLIII